MRCVGIAVVLAPKLGHDRWSELSNNRAMVRAKPLSQYALRVLAKIHVTGVYVWVRGTAAFLDDPQRTRVRFDAVNALLQAGYLVEDPEEFTLEISTAGRALLERAVEGPRSPTPDATL